MIRRMRVIGKIYVILMALILKTKGEPDGIPLTIYKF